jgi:enoyl-CoA hydratase/carnithine racemase
MAEPTPFRRSQENGVLTFTFTRDAKLNAVSPAMIDGLRAAVDDLGERDDLKVLVISARDFDRYANTALLASDEHKSMLEAFKNRKHPPRPAPGNETG